MKVWYSSSDEEDPVRYSTEVPTPTDITRPIEQRQVAEECADHFHSWRGGLFAQWPRDITLYATEDGPPLASFMVERKMVPEFYATRKERTV